MVAARKIQYQKAARADREESRGILASSRRNMRWGWAYHREETHQEEFEEEGEEMGE